MSITVGSLFAGIAGFDLGFARAGLRTSWVVEIDRDARRVLARHFPDAALYEDVRECGRHNLSPVDVISGGFPCQGLSCAGKRGGLKDARSGLFYEMVRIADELRPKLLVFENVPGLLSGKDEEDDGEEDEEDDAGSAGGGRGAGCDPDSGLRGRPADEPATVTVRWMGAVLEELARVRFYGAWRVLDSRYHGVAQRRRRVFGMFTRVDPGDGKRLAGAAPGEDASRLERVYREILALPPGGGRHPASRRQKEARVAPCVRAGVNRSGEPERGDVAPLVAPRERARVEEAGGQLLPFNIIGMAREGRNHAYPAEVSGCLQHKGLNPTGNEAGTVVAYVNPRILGNQHKASSNQVGIKDGSLSDCLQSDGGGAVAHTLRAEGTDVSEDGTGRGTPPIAFHPLQDPITSAGVTHALGCGSAKGAATVGISQGLSVRRLTATECLRLQAFPDDYLDLDPPLSDSKKYALVGNACTVNVTHWLGKRVVAVLGGLA